MKLVREHINEKFEEESDPLHDMGIGIVAVREFDTLEEAAKTYVENIKILSAGEFQSKKHLRKSIIDSRKYYTQTGIRSTLRECKNFLDGKIGERKFDPLTIKEWGERFDKQESKLQCLKDFRDEVINYALNDKHIDEKFSENSDPIEDMGIGIYTQLQKEYNKIEDMGVKKSAEYLFNSDTYGSIAGIAVKTIITLIIKDKLLDEKNINNFEKVLDDVRQKYGLSAFGVEIIIKYFKRKFKIKIPLFYKQIYEKFSEKSDPIEDMGIGMKEFYRNMFKQKGQMNSYEGSKEYFGDEDHPEESFTIFKILQYIVNNNISSHKELAKAAKHVIKKRQYTSMHKHEMELLKKALKDHLYIDLY